MARTYQSEASRYDLKCKRFAPTLKKEGYVKIIECGLAAKHEALHQMVGLKRPDVLMLSASKAAQARKANLSIEDPDEAMEDNSFHGSDESVASEGEGDDLDASGQLQGSIDNAGQANKETAPKTGGKQQKRSERPMMPEEARAHLRLAFQNSPALMNVLYGRHGAFASDAISADMFFLEVLPVPPTRFRPPAKMGEMIFENPQNELLGKVLRTTFRIRDVHLCLQGQAERVATLAIRRITQKQALMQMFFQELFQLQTDVNSFMDQSKNPTVMRQGKLPPQGIKQILEKKEGLFRKHMMVCYFNQVMIV